MVQGVVYRTTKHPIPTANRPRLCTACFMQLISNHDTFKNENGESAQPTAPDPLLLDRLTQSTLKDGDIATLSSKEMPRASLDMKISANQKGESKQAVKAQQSKPLHISLR